MQYDNFSQLIQGTLKSSIEALSVWDIICYNIILGTDVTYIYKNKWTV